MFNHYYGIALVAQRIDDFDELLGILGVETDASLGALLASDKTGKLPIVSACCYPDTLPDGSIRSRSSVFEVAKRFYLLVLTVYHGRQHFSSLTR